MLALLPVVVDMTNLHIAAPSLTLALGVSATEVLLIIGIYPLLMGGLLALVCGIKTAIGANAQAVTVLAPGYFGWEPLWR